MSERLKILLDRTVTVMAIVCLIWVKFRAPLSLQISIAYLGIGAAFCVVSYCTIRLWRSHIEHNHSPKGNAILVKARSRAIFYLGIACIGLGFVAYVLSLSRTRAPIDLDFQSWLGLAFALLVVGFMFTWFGAYEFRIAGNVVEYWSLLGGYRSLVFDDIDRARIRIGRVNYRDQYRPMIRLEIVPRECKQHRPIIVNLKAFAKEQMDQLFDWLGAKLEDQDTIERIHKHSHP